MRLAMGLTVVGAALLACGVMLVLVGSILRLNSPHDGQGFVHAGEAVAICGLAFGVGLLVVVIIDVADRAGRGGQGRSRKGSGPRPVSGGLIALPSPETGLAELRQEPVVELKLASRYPRPDHSDNRWQPDAGNGSYPHPDNGSDPRADGIWSRGAAYVWSPRDDWDGSGEGGWSPAEADDWAGDGRGGWDPHGPADWGQSGQLDQQEWAAAGQGGWGPAGQTGWGPAGQGGWGSPGQDGWARGGQQQWAPDGQEQWAPDDQGGWVRAGQGGWGPAGQGDWGQGGQQDQQEWAAAAQDGWARDGLGDWAAAAHGGWGHGGQQDQQEWAAAGQGGWGPPGQDGWDRAGQEQWAPDGQGGWVRAGQGGWGPAGQGGWGDGGLPQWAPAGEPNSGGRPEWAPAGQGGWATGGDDGWGFAEPAASRIDPTAPGESARTPAPSGEKPESVNGPQLTDVAGPGVAAEPTQHAPRAAPSESAPDIAVTKSAGSDDGAMDDTTPLPVILNMSPSGPKAAEDEEPQPATQPGENQSAPFSVFEPAPKKSVFEPGPKRSVFEPGPEAPERDRGSARGSHPGDADRRAKADPLPAETQAKLEQIKDLYLTAEAIGEDALVKHFDQLSQRQRSLIGEFFERAGLGPSRTSARLSGDSADDGASPPNGESTQDSASLPG
jgi:hypothetical protein